ncbi:MAG: gliding motility-associated C-terminal domain-containing protein, partial [Flavobacteriales bacterium]|nr:gliding motility-associated C-terminal domain-containing protein [Flavobacteriales bacterium]
NIVTSPEAAFTYNSPFCQGSTTTTLPSFTINNLPGIFSSSPTGIVFINTSTGQIDLVNSSPGTYMVFNNLAPAGGCAAAIDSTQIIINPMFNLQEVVAICSGNSYTFPDGTTQNNITTQLVYLSNLVTANSCDSIIQTTVNINPIFNITESTAVCNGDSYTFPDGTTQTNITTQTIYTSNLLTINGCDSIIQTTVNIDPQLNIVANPFDTICLGNSLVLTATSSGNGIITWYSDFAGTNVIGTGSPFSPPTPLSIGSFTYYVNETGNCPSQMDSVILNVQSVTAQINASPLSGFSPLLVNFGNGSTGANGYLWDFSNGNTDTIFNPSQTYTDPGNYQVVLIATDGLCWDTTFVVIEVFNESSILIPNVFTPNGDGINDIFTVDGLNIKSVEGEIYNRWGQKMFSWKNIKGHWDGRTLAGSKAPDGTYFYIIKAEGNDGEKYFEKGGFSLIR